MLTARRVTSWVGLLGLAGTVCALGHHFGGRAHIRRRLGQEPLAQASCFNCHFVATQNLPWAKTRLHHDCPAGLALSPDGTRLFVALDDRNEIAETDTTTYKVLRRANVSGKPYGLAFDSNGKTLFVTCKDQDRVVALDAETLKETGAIPVGMGPTAVALCRTASGERLVVANSMSADLSTLTWN